MAELPKMVEISFGTDRHFEVKAAEYATRHGLDLNARPKPKTGSTPPKPRDPNELRKGIITG
ncbi:hypothetical protein HZC07_04055 [Candidatus Micrarchaeota archaeon]|nr:hypothetical protein [Candidatus Micrarchaeota archaeon]